MRLILTFIFSLAATQVWAADEVEKVEQGDFRAPQSMLETAERLMASERDLGKRLEFLIRWIKIREDLELTERQAKFTDAGDPAALKHFQDAKMEIIERLTKEIPRFEKAKIQLDRIHRELGFRYLEQKKFAEAQQHYEALSVKTPDDEISYGDCLMQLGLTDLALYAYVRAGQAERLRSVAAYKRAWAFLQMHDFLRSLFEFDVALEDNPYSPAKLREEAFRDRLRPYIETFSKPDFVATDASVLQQMATRIQPPSGGELYLDALRLLVEGFNSKNDVRRAQQVFGFLVQAIPHAQSDTALKVLVVAAPLWLRVHRGRLEHDDVERILKTFPDKEVDAASTTELQAELNNNAAFYETLVQDNKEDAEKLGPRYRSLLLLTYNKYLTLYPKEVTADPLRVNYARLLLQDGDPENCLKVLAQRTKKEATIESMAQGLEGQCELKQLDKLYAATHDENFYARLSQNILDNKIYLRKEIGIPETQVFLSLVQMLMGSLKKNTQSGSLRKTLTSLYEAYPYSKEEPLFKEIQIVRAELEFEDLLASPLDGNEKAKRFYAIFERAPLGASVAIKALKNSVLFGTDAETLNRCDKYQQLEPKDFGRQSEMFKRCLALSERHLLLDRELAYWNLYEKGLSEVERVRVGLLHLALGREQEGKLILGKLKSENANHALAFFYGQGQQESAPALDPKVAELIQETRSFVKDLKQISFQKIGKVVPAAIQNFKALDAKWVKLSKKGNVSPLAFAQALDHRAFISSRMRDWMKNLPEPKDLTPEELIQYRTQALQVVKPWEELADAAMKECSSQAYALSPDFEKSPSCPEATNEKTWNEFMKTWESTRQAAEIDSPWDEAKATDEQKILRNLYTAGMAETNSLKARYFLLRAYDMTSSRWQKGQIQLMMAKITDKERFWRSAAELDGNLVEPIQWLKTRANGNPFFDRLYDKQIELIKRRVRYTPVDSVSQL